MSEFFNKYFYDFSQLFKNINNKDLVDSKACNYIEAMHLLLLKIINYYIIAKSIFKS